LKRVIQQRLLNPLATELLKGAVAAGGRLTIDARDGDFVFHETCNASAEAATVVETESVT
jgi:ATP-dependent Clp protease ATP-binding subunit ClpA